MPRSRD
jgi:carbon monoxide dehydrogenase subunit G